MNEFKMSDPKHTFRLPTIKFDRREDLVNFLIHNPCEFIFEKAEEVINPVGFQWDVTLSSKVYSEDIGFAIIKYKESFFNENLYPKDFYSDWLKSACPFVKNWYKGEIDS